MRILQVAPFFSPQMGGSPQVVYQTSRELASRGHQVTVLAGDYRINEAVFPDQTFTSVILPSPISKMGFYITPGLIPWINTHIHEFDLIHLHELRTFQNIIVRSCALRANVPFVLSAHGTLPIIVQRQFFKRVYDLLFGRAILASARRLVAVSPTEAQQYRQAGIQENRIKVIYNGLNIEEFDGLTRPGVFRKNRFGLDEKSKIILFLGRLHRTKGIDILIEAFAQLQVGPFQTRLVIAGPDNGEQVKLQALAQHLNIQDCILFVGPLYGSEKLELLASADVVASPSSHEIFGLVSFEALMCGAPVITTEDSGLGQIIQECGGGYLVPYGNAPALADALRYVLSHPDEARQKVKAGQRFVHERMNWKTNISELEQLYSEVVFRNNI